MLTVRTWSFARLSWIARILIHHPDNITPFTSAEFHVSCKFCQLPYNVPFTMTDEERVAKKNCWSCTTCYCPKLHKIVVKYDRSLMFFTTLVEWIRNTALRSLVTTCLTAKYHAHSRVFLRQKMSMLPSRLSNSISMLFKHTVRLCL